ncbi:hypothetical protein LTR62_001805 [Meristemomyces frigidus]|uniref:Uncharacterized protein n=1 Tax=Meristemomyces frigidus TaxID=1508187 RepID=A0AAN7TH68_9PEZI|nr:hypothetical protein LTR62_001805 [Meristemomyces frigidus]
MPRDRPQPPKSGKTGNGQPVPQPNTNSKKRKEAPTTNDNAPKKPRFDNRAKARDARTILAQPTKSFKNGELDVDQFVRAREYEIRALEDGMARSKKGLNRRAFQQVPPELRRRTASHNVKRVPKRLRERAKREMADDNTPIVNAKTRRPTRRLRLRLETAKALRALGSKRKAAKEKAKEEKVLVHVPDSAKAATKGNENGKKPDRQHTTTNAMSKTKKARLAIPPLPKAKFRKRQIHKSWLPTHMYHAKRARMTPPSAPLWRFSIPLSPNNKSYRPTHRASRDRGAVAWDTSYVSTIALDGRQDSIVGILKALGVSDADLTGRTRMKWSSGTRVLEVFLYEREAPHRLIAPATAIWCALPRAADAQSLPTSDTKRKLLLRVQPSTFFQLWEELVRLSKVAKPQVMVEDLRFAIGSIDLTGPGATEALLGALWPVAAERAYSESDATQIDASITQSVGDVWTKLIGLTNMATLPQNALLGFDVQDPRLHHPPRTIKLPKTESEQVQLLETIAAWPVDTAQTSPSLFNSKARRAASTSLPSQKAVNRRQALAPLGQYPSPTPQDPKIPVLLFTGYTSSPSTKAKNNSAYSTAPQATWTLLAPWKCIQPIWYSLMYYPLSTGTQPRFGGLDQKRQVAFEAGEPWFPADFPGTKAGWEWELRERKERLAFWARRPKGKRISWEKVDLGQGRRGEVGSGWCCDWMRLLEGPPREVIAVGAADASSVAIPNASNEAKATDSAPNGAAATAPPLPLPQMPTGLSQLSPSSADLLLNGGTLPPHINLSSVLAAVRVRAISRGTPKPCGRIYRLPSFTTNEKLRKQWLDLLPSNQKNSGRKHGPKHSLPKVVGKDVPAHIAQQRLAASLLEPPRVGEDDYPACPGEEDLIGFITTGNFNLSEGQGTGIGSLLIARVLESAGEEKRLCILRNAGESICRLARWEVAG